MHQGARLALPIEAFRSNFAWRAVYWAESGPARFHFPLFRGLTHLLDVARGDHSQASVCCLGALPRCEEKRCPCSWGRQLTVPCSALSLPLFRFSPLATESFDTRHHFLSAFHVVCNSCCCWCDSWLNASCSPLLSAGSVHYLLIRASG